MGFFFIIMHIRGCLMMYISVLIYQFFAFQIHLSENFDVTLSVLYFRFPQTLYNSILWYFNL